MNAMDQPNILSYDKWYCISLNNDINIELVQNTINKQYKKILKFSLTILTNKDLSIFKTMQDNYNKNIFNKLLLNIYNNIINLKHKIIEYDDYFKIRTRYIDELNTLDETQFKLV